MPTTWKFADRTFTVMGTQGDCEYAHDQNGSMYYRFINRDPADKRESWKYVTNTYRICKPTA